MDNNKRADDQLKHELEHLEEADIDRLKDSDLETVAGGLEDTARLEEEAAGDCVFSLWCCSNG